jgi:hypothetical protein
MRSTIFILLLITAAVPRLVAQSYGEHIARGDSLSDVLDPAGALEEYRAAFMANPSSYEAMWKFAGAQIDVAKQLRDRQYQDLRDSLYWVARIYAEAATSTDSTDAEGFFMLSQSLGRLSLTRRPGNRVRPHARRRVPRSRCLARRDQAAVRAHEVLRNDVSGRELHGPR